MKYIILLLFPVLLQAQEVSIYSDRCKCETVDQQTESCEVTINKDEILLSRSSKFYVHKAYIKHYNSTYYHEAYCLTFSAYKFDSEVTIFFDRKKIPRA